MALRKCYNCGGELKHDASGCAKCGSPLQQEVSAARKAPIGIIALVSGGVVFALLAMALIACKREEPRKPESAETPNLAEIQPRAEKGDAEAQRNLGIVYAKGLGVKQDYGEAAKWYRQAAEQGNPAAQTAIGELYEAGRGVPRDNEEAAKWYRRAADQGYASAQYALAALYVMG